MKRLISMMMIAFLFLLAGCGGNNSKPQSSPSTQPINTASSVPTNTPSNTPTGTSIENAATSQPNSIETPTSTTETALDYFPFNKNVYKDFSGFGSEYADFELYTDFTSKDLIQQREINAGTTSAKVYKVSKEKVEQVYSRGEAYYKLNFLHKKNTSDILIETPIEVGTEWKASSGYKRSITAINKSLQLPAGNYKALEITTEGEEGTRMKDYYVKGLGLVLSEYYEKNSDTPMVTSKLKQVVKSKEFQQTLKIYFPDYYNDKSKFVTRNIRFKTDEDVKYKLQKELKIVPVNSHLSKVLTTHSKILNLEIDEDGKVATINLSKDFTEEMNEGSAFEGLLIQCLVNTIGDYFGADKVVITIEGKSYESGHFSELTGEVFNIDKSNVLEYKLN